VRASASASANRAASSRLNGLGFVACCRVIGDNYPYRTAAKLRPLWETETGQEATTERDDVAADDEVRRLLSTGRWAGPSTVVEPPPARP